MIDFHFNPNIERDTFATSNAIFNSLLGGGFDTQRLYVLVGETAVLNKIKTIIPQNNNIVLLEEKIYSISDSHKLRNKSLLESKAYIQLIEIPSGADGEDLVKIKDTYVSCDTLIFLKDSPYHVRLKITKQRKNVQHGLAMPCFVEL